MKHTAIGQDQTVTLLDGSTKRYVNLDNAASTPALRAVKDAVDAFLPYYSSVHRGSGYKSRVSTEAYEQARQMVLEFFGGDAKDHVVVFGMNTSEAVNVLAHRMEFSEKDIVLVSMLEHHSNDLPWRHANMKRIKLTKHGQVDMEHLTKLIEEHGSDIKLVTITGASNVTGHISDIHQAARLAHGVGAEILVDGAQLAPHRPITMKSLDDEEHIDYLAVSAHKMYAPFGTGALIARKDRLEHGAPVYSGGGTIDFVSLDDVVWAPPPERDEVGSPNVVGAVAFAASLMYLQRAGMDALVAEEQELVRYAIDKLQTVEGVQLFGATEPEQLKDRTGVISFAVEGVNHALVAEILAAEYGVGVRSGCFCAHPYVIELLGINQGDLHDLKATKTAKHKKPIPGLVRISFGLYNTTEDIDRCIDGLKAITDGSYRKAAYSFNEISGVYEAKNWPTSLKITS